MKSQNNGGSTPSQYALPPDATEIIDLVEYRDMNFSMGNIMKAVYRYGHCDHSTALYDLNKIIYFAQREIARIEKDGV